MKTGRSLDDLAIRLRLRIGELNAAGGNEELLEIANAYLRLDERLAKIIAIGDKYQAEALEAAGRLRDALEQLEAYKAASPVPPARSREGNSAAALKGEKGMRRRSDPLLERLRAAVSGPEASVPALDVAVLLKRYEKLDLRMDKIVTISDRYQSQLRDISMRMDFMARTDALTDLPNRRDMIDRLDSEVRRFERYGTEFSVILFDIDDFKHVNDSWGHDVGDRVLRNVALVFLRELRNTDSCARWGGEEFLVLCPETTKAEAILVGEKCRRAIEVARVELAEGAVGVTLSGGIAAMESGLDRDGLIKRADEGLYRAKSAGKNLIS
jgi:diguanylate cyclase